MQYEKVLDPEGAVTWLRRLVAKYKFRTRDGDNLVPVLSYNSAPHITVRRLPGHTSAVTTMRFGWGDPLALRSGICSQSMFYFGASWAAVRRPPPNLHFPTTCTQALNKTFDIEAAKMKSLWFNSQALMEKNETLRSVVRIINKQIDKVWIDRQGVDRQGVDNQGKEMCQISCSMSIGIQRGAHQY